MKLYLELLVLRDKFTEYKELVYNSGNLLPQKGEDLRQELIERIAPIKSRLTEVTGKQYYTQFNRTRDTRDTALGSIVDISDRKTATSLCLDIINEAIGKLNGEKESWSENRIQINDGLLDTRSNKFWKWVESHRILTLIYLLAAIATIVSTLYLIINP